MSKAKCYYEILGVSETASGDEIKRAYKTQALLWHPDKNQSNLDEAHAQFQAILKAYETLSDSRERDWYDRHKDQILSGGTAEDVGSSSKNLFQYFSSACYANFDDSDDGFYTVYRNVFADITDEELNSIQNMAKFTKDKSRNKNDLSTDQFPSFGKSDSNYVDVVKPFYDFWSGFCTQLTFDNLDKYNTTEAENRRILRAMEKENKKVKDAAKKERNMNVRNLVEFIKKRDKRLKAHKLLIDQQNELNRRKTQEKQRQQRERSQKQSNEYKPSAWLELDDVEEQLLQLENEYDEYDLKRGKKGRNIRHYSDDESDYEIQAEAGETDMTTSDRPEQSDKNPEGDASVDENIDGEEQEEEEEEENFSCPACNKDFRTVKALENHEASKKHKQKIQKLAKLFETKND